VAGSGRAAPAPAAGRRPRLLVEFLCPDAIDDLQSADGDNKCATTNIDS